MCVRMYVYARVCACVWVYLCACASECVSVRAWACICMCVVCLLLLVLSTSEGMLAALKIPRVPRCWLRVRRRVSSRALGSETSPVVPSCSTSSFPRRIFIGITVRYGNDRRQFTTGTGRAGHLSCWPSWSLVEEKVRRFFGRELRSAFLSLLILYLLSFALRPANPRRQLRCSTIIRRGAFLERIALPRGESVAQ